MLTSLIKRIIAIFTLVLSISSINLSSAQATDTLLLETGLEWCQGCYDGWTVSSGADQWIAFLVTSSGAATISKVELNINNTNAASLSGTTVEFYSTPASSPTNIANRLGTLTFSEFRLQPSQTTSGAAVFLGSVEIPSAGNYWFKFGNLSATKSARYRFGSISYASGTWSPYQGANNTVFFNGSLQTVANYFPAMRITGSAGGGGGGSSTPTAEELANAARDQRNKDVEIAKNKIQTVLKSGGSLSIQDLLSADFTGISPTNLESVNRDIAQLPSEKKNDLLEIGKVINRYALIDKVSRGERFYFQQLTQLDLAPQNMANRGFVMRELQNVPSFLLETPEQFRLAVLEALAKAEARRTYVRSKLVAISQSILSRKTP